MTKQDSGNSNFSGKCVYKNNGTCTCENVVAQK